jgi:mannosyl-oligosaccharide alpha-1,2-mannosidase
VNALAGIATLHLEFIYLSEISGDPIFAEKAQHILNYLRDLEKPKGLYRAFLDVDTGNFTDENYITIGGLGWIRKS